MTHEEHKVLVVQMLEDDFGIENADELTRFQIKEIITLLSFLEKG